MVEGLTNNINKVLIEKEIKQTWLAEKPDKRFTIVNSYVCNYRQPSLELLFYIAQSLQVNSKDLINTTQMTNKVSTHKNNMMIDFEEYIRLSEPHKRKKGYAWQTTIGLRAVDGLKTSEYPRKHHNQSYYLGTARLNEFTLSNRNN